jgi:flagellar biosynthetic protein FliR
MGLLIGLALRLILTALNVAGTVIAIQSGLAFIQTIDPTQGAQGSLVANFLSLIGVVVIFAADLHVMPIAALRDSYTLFPPGHWPDMQDMVKTVIDTVSASFRLGMQIAAPFIVFGIVFNIALGVLARLIPQMQVTFITLPAQLLVAFALLSMTLGTAVTLYLDYFTKRLQTFLL